MVSKKEIPRRNLKFCEGKGCVSYLFKVSIVQDGIVITVVKLNATSSQFRGEATKYEYCTQVLVILDWFS